MSEADIRRMIDRASRFCEKQFAKSGVVYPLYHAIAGNGEQLVVPPPHVESKDIAVAMIRALFKDKDVIRYVFMDEAWTIRGEKGISPEKMARFNREGLSEQPGRIEVVFFSAEDRDCGQLTAERLIVRPANGQPYLAPLHMFESKMGSTITSEGRMIGLLPMRGTRQ
jgi:hypothetical protein